MGCLPVRGDNPRALASGLSPRTGVQTWHNYLIPPTSVVVDLAHHEIFRAEVGNGGINLSDVQLLKITNCTKLY